MSSIETIDLRVVFLAQILQQGTQGPQQLTFSE